MVPLFPSIPLSGLLLALLVNLVAAGLVGFLVRAHAGRRRLHGPAWGGLVGLCTLFGSLVGLAVGLSVYAVRLFLQWYDPAVPPADGRR